MEVEQIKDEQKDTDLNESITRKKKIITSYDKNNEAYYSEMNSREPTTIHQSIDYYELLKQQIKYYKELNSSLKNEIETVKHCKRLKELEKLNEMDKLELKNLKNRKEELNNLISPEKNDGKLINMKNTLDNKFDKEIEFEASKEQWLIVEKEMKRLENENQSLKNSVEQLNDTIHNLKYPDEGNNSYVNSQDISSSADDNQKSIDMGNKLMIDNNRLKIYIEKIGFILFTKNINNMF